MSNLHNFKKNPSYAKAYIETNTPQVDGTRNYGAMEKIQKAIHNRAK